MADAWGGAWGTAWGSAWGDSPHTPATGDRFTERSPNAVMGKPYGTFIAKTEAAATAVSDYIIRVRRRRM